MIFLLVFCSVSDIIYSGRRKVDARARSFVEVFFVEIVGCDYVVALGCLEDVLGVVVHGVLVEDFLEVGEFLDGRIAVELAYHVVELLGAYDVCGSVAATIIDINFIIRWFPIILIIFALILDYIWLGR